MKYSATPTEELRDLLIDKLIENPNDIVIEDTIDYINNTQKEITRLQQENKQQKNKIKEKIKDLEENNNGDNYSLINVVNILKDLLGDKE